MDNLVMNTLGTKNNHLGRIHTLTSSAKLEKLTVLYEISFQATREKKLVI
jgi:hypothetical protein